MKIFLIAMLSLGLSACHVSSSTEESSAPPVPPAQEDPSKPDQPSTETGTPEPAKSPFSFPAMQKSVDGKTISLPLIEILDLVPIDGKKRVEIRLLSSAPNALCDIDAFYNSFELEFSYTKISIENKVGEQTLAPFSQLASIGTHGSQGHRRQAYGSGKVVLTSADRGNYSGWMDLIMQDGSVVQGNFQAVHCSHTHELMKNMGLSNMDKIVTLYNQTGGYPLEVRVQSKEFPDDSVLPTYKEYVVDRSGVQISFTPVRTDFSRGTVTAGGRVAGKYASAGNTTCLGNSSAAMLEFDGPTLYLNQRSNRPYFCSAYLYESETIYNSAIVKYDPVQKSRSVELSTKLGNYKGTF
jgi:hypothetical protein